MRVFRMAAMGLVVLGLCNAAAEAWAARPSGPRLVSGSMRLEAGIASPGRHRLRLVRASGAAAGSAALLPTPLWLEVIGADGSARWLSGDYTTVRLTGGHLICEGVVRTPGGSVFRFHDTYRTASDAGAFRIDRRVEVVRVRAGDAGFSTRFVLSPPSTGRLANLDGFMPGVWYSDNRTAPPHALAGDMSSRFIYVREDRLPLPLVMTRDRRSGVTLALTHVGGVPTTFAGEDFLKRLVDGRMQFGSLGVVTTDRPSVAFLFPGTEGERTYVMGGSREKRWALRSHPVRAGVKHAYSLVFHVSRSADYASAVRGAWKGAWDAAKPPVRRVDVPRFYKQGIDLLSAYARTYNGTPGLPFGVRVPGGEVDSVSLQMGFIGQQIPAGYHLIRYGLRFGDAGRVSRGEAIVDFWAAESLTADGLPRTWYDVEGRKGWRNYNTYLRVASDGMDGALSAWREMRRAGRDRPAWLAFCRRYGDWLVAHQSPDGSFARCFDFSGNPVETSKNNTTHPIPFLVHLFDVTKDAQYRESALKAGAFCLEDVHRVYRYVGGTPDNPDVTDKEAGLKALDAFLNLHEMTGERRWLDAAVQAAWFGETWLVAWDIPVPSGDAQADFPGGRTTHGLSLIATGHSGADTFMAAYVCQYYRLYRLAGERHFLEVSRFLLHATKQLTDWDGTLGHAHRALQTEALSLSLLRGHSVKLWLPWLTVGQLDSLTQLEDDYGSMDVDAIRYAPVSVRKATAPRPSRATPS